ncbi:IS4 family transposase [Duganella sp.]|uniref:IS4 family transposase n=1 Tax=Duganella sp. TaxID=1904440 RepID=UPI0031D1F761
MQVLVNGRIPVVAKLKNQTRNMFSISTFHQIMKGLPRSSFDQLVKKHKANKYCKGFGPWQHLLTMVYAQLSGAEGLRPLAAGFNRHLAHHYHLDARCIRRTTLADANERRSVAVFNETANWLITKLAGTLGREARDLTYLLDSTSITLKGREFERWTADNATRNTQGLKLHLLLDANSKIPLWQTMTAPNINDVLQARAVPLQAGALYVFDKGYCDYNWWHCIDEAQATFVTRFKSNANLVTDKELEIPQQARETVLADELLRFKHKTPGGKRHNAYEKLLRRVTVVRPGSSPLVFATNDLTSPALEIAQRYKERWGIELFFKWIKQHLRIKRFLGRSENAVRIQLLTALISYLLVELYRQQRWRKLTCWECLCIVRATLFQRPDTDISSYRRRRENANTMAKLQPSLF